MSLIIVPGRDQASGAEAGEENRDPGQHADEHPDSGTWERLGCSGGSAGGTFTMYQKRDKISANVARFRLYRHRFLQENMRFAAFFKIYQILKLNFFEI